MPEPVCKSQESGGYKEDDFLCWPLLNISYEILL